MHLFLYAVVRNDRNPYGQHLNDSTVLENIAKIESTGKSLGNSFVIKNGLATLANDIFIFKAEKSDSQYYYISRDGKNYRIEKDICRDIIKPNILKSEVPQGYP